MSNKRKSKSTKELIAAARLPERTVDVCLRGDLVSEHQELEAELRQARNEESGNDRLGGSRAGQIAKKVEAIEAEMQESTVSVRLRALPRKRWRALMDDHPPKKGDKGDEAVGVHLETFLHEAARECLIDDDLREAWDDLPLTSGEYDRLTTAAWDLNRRGVDVPKSSLASLITQRNAGASK